METIGRDMVQLAPTPPNPPARAIVMTSILTITAALLIAYAALTLIDSETLP